MARPITLFTGQWAALPFEEVARLSGEWGYNGLDSVLRGHLDVSRWDDCAYVQSRHDILKRHGLEVPMCTATATIAQLPAALAGVPARGRCRRLRTGLRQRRAVVIYGGSAGPGPLTEPRHAVDGLCLGRFVHDLDNLMTVLDEAAVRCAQRGNVQVSQWMTIRFDEVQPGIDQGSPRGPRASSERRSSRFSRGWRA